MRKVAQDNLNGVDSFLGKGQTGRQKISPFTTTPLNSIGLIQLPPKIHIIDTF